MTDELWRDEGGEYLFHYTEARLARQIAEDEHFLVGTGALHGPGLYATDLMPLEATPEEIRAICFGGDAASLAFDGVLVLLADDPLTPFERVEPRVHLLNAPEGIGEVIPLHSLLIGVGWREASGIWTIECWP